MGCRAGIATGRPAAASGLEILFLIEFKRSPLLLRPSGDSLYVKILEIRVDLRVNVDEAQHLGEVIAGVGEVHV